MGKSSRKKFLAKSHRSLRPSMEEFRIGLARAQAWEHLRASDSDVQELATLIDDHSFWQQQAELASSIEQYTGELIDRGIDLCAAMDWHLLAVIIEGYFAIA